MKTKLIVLAISMLCIGQVSAQQYYEWDEYGISFTLADDFVEERNDGEEFSAQGDGMSMSIFPFKDASIDDSDIAAYVIDIASSLDLEEVDDVDLIKLNYFKGGYVEGYKDGARIFLLGMIDPNSETNFFVVITFADDDQNAVDEAISIVSSINKL